MKTKTRIVAAAWAAVIGGVVSAADPTPMSRDEVVAFLAPGVPKKGSLEVVFALSREPLTPRAVGVDFSTGACYQAQEGTVRGADPTGASYKGQPRTNGLARGSAPGDVVSTDMLTISIPTVVARDLISNPDLITRAERRADGGIDVWSDLLEGQRHPPQFGPDSTPKVFTFKWEFDQRGRLKRSSSTMNGFVGEYAYLENAPDGVNICTNAGFPQAYRLFSYDWQPDPDPRRFGMAAVETRLVAMDLPSFDDPRRKGMTVEAARKFGASRAAGALATTSPGVPGWVWIASALGTAAGVAVFLVLRARWAA